MPLYELGVELLIVDDSPERIHTDSLDNFIPIKRWFGSQKDKELLRVLKIIKKRWKLPTPARSKKRSQQAKAG